MNSDLLQPCRPQVYRQSPDCHQPDTEGESEEVLQGEQPPGPPEPDADVIYGSINK